MTKLNVALAAEESAGVQALRLVAAAGHEPALVLTSRESAVAAAAAELGVPAAPAELVADVELAPQLVERSVDLLLNVHSLHVVESEVLEAPRIGCFNLHPGPLPEYAGLNVPSWAIFRGESTHGVTVHWMAPEVDAGPIAYTDSFEIDPADTGLSLTVKCARQGKELIARLLADAALDPRRIPADEQDMSRRHYFEPGPPNGGLVPWAGPARGVIDLVRASDYGPFASPWGRPHTLLGDRRIELLGASPSGEPTDVEPGTTATAEGRGLMVAAADEWVLLDRVAVDGETSEASALLGPGERFDPGSPPPSSGWIGSGDRG